MQITTEGLKFVATNEFKQTITLLKNLDIELAAVYTAISMCSDVNRKVECPDEDVQFFMEHNVAAINAVINT